MLRITIESRDIPIMRALDIQEYAGALRGKVNGLSFDFDDVSGAQKFASTLVGMELEFNVKHSPVSCCWAGEGCCKPEGGHHG